MVGAERVVTAERVIPATPAAIFDVLADPARHAEIDGSSTVEGLRAAVPRLTLGARFSMRMRHRLPYVTSNVVVEFEEGRRIAWCHVARFVWRYELEPAGEGTTVTETFDYSKPWGVLIEPLGWPERNRRSMAATLERLERVVTRPSGPPQGRAPSPPA